MTCPPVTSFYGTDSVITNGVFTHIGIWTLFWYGNTYPFLDHKCAISPYLGLHHLIGGFKRWCNMVSPYAGDTVPMSNMPLEGCHREYSTLCHICYWHKEGSYLDPFWQIPCQEWIRTGQLGDLVVGPISGPKPCQLSYPKPHVHLFRKRGVLHKVRILAFRG